MLLITNKSSPVNSSEETTEPVSNGRRDPIDSTDTTARGRERKKPYSTVANLIKDTVLLFSNVSNLHWAGLSRNLTVGCQGIFNMGAGISQKQCTRSHLREIILLTIIYDNCSPSVSEPVYNTKDLWLINIKFINKCESDRPGKGRMQKESEQQNHIWSLNMFLQKVDQWLFGKLVGFGREQSTTRSAQARQQQTEINTFMQEKAELWGVIYLPQQHYCKAGVLVHCKTILWNTPALAPKQSHPVSDQPVTCSASCESPLPWEFHWSCDTGWIPQCIAQHRGPAGVRHAVKDGSDPKFISTSILKSSFTTSDAVTPC